MSILTKATEIVDPRRSSKKSTTYTATGDLEAPAKLDSELGSAQPTVIRDPVPELATPQQALKTYTKMTRSDAAVDVSLRAAKVSVLGAEFYIEPFSNDQENLDIAEFIHYNLFEGLSQPFSMSLEDIMRMLEHGFSVLEICWYLGTWAPRRTNANGKRYTMLQKLAARPSATIKEFKRDDNGGPVEILQGAINAKDEIKDITIPIGKAMVFSFQKEGGDLRGKSILRTAYPHWYYKTHFYKIDGIQKERHAIGVPRAHIHAGASDEDKRIAREVVKNLRVNEQAHILETDNVTFDFVKLEGSLVDVLKSADHHNAMIMLNVMVQFLIMGLTEGGGRATSSAQTDMFQKSLRYLANFICECFNMWLIPKLVAYNFKTNRYPEMRVRNIGETRDLQMLASAFSNLLSERGITGDLETENWLRKTFDMPLKTTDPGEEAYLQTSTSSDKKNSSQGGAGVRKGAAPSAPGGDA